MGAKGERRLKNRFFWGTCRFLIDVRPSDEISVHSAQSMAWKIKMNLSNDNELRQESPGR